jgi:hypothetical protein
MFSTVKTMLSTEFKSASVCVCMRMRACAYMSVCIKTKGIGNTLCFLVDLMTFLNYVGYIVSNGICLWTVTWEGCGRKQL